MAIGGLTLQRLRVAVTTPRVDRRVLVFAAALGCIPLAFFVYWPRLNDYFVFDDFFFLHAVRNHGFVEVMRRAFSFPEQRPFDEVTLFWRPSIDLYFYVMRPFGVDPQPYHVVNVFLHGLVGALAVWFLWRLIRSPIGAAATGLLFVVAPTFGLAVTWVAEVSELLDAVLVLGALTSYHAYLTNERRDPRLLAITLVFTVAALLTKESAAILVVLFPALVFAVPAAERRRTWSEVARALAPLLLLAVGFVLAMGLHDAFNEEERLHSLGMHMPRNLWRYLTWMVFPCRPDDYRVAREVGASLFLTAGAVSILLRQRALAFFFVWAIVALLPFTGFDEWTELRYTYLATLPFIAFAVFGIITAIDRLPRPAVAPATAVLSVAVLAALVVSPMRTRDQQSWIAGQAGGYEAMVDGVRGLCGEMPPDSHIYVLGAPYDDLWGIHTPAAVNLYYDHVYAQPVDELPALIGYIEHRCVIRYDAATARYVLLERT